MNIEGKPVAVKFAAIVHVFLWTATCENEIRQEDAIALQELHKYPIEGYGFGQFECTQFDDYYQATWQCASTCD
jgi:hypothetical protein